MTQQQNFRLSDQSQFTTPMSTASPVQRYQSPCPPQRLPSASPITQQPLTPLRAPNTPLQGGNMQFRGPNTPLRGPSTPNMTSNTLLQHPSTPLRPPTSIKPIPTTPQPLPNIQSSVQSISILSQDDIVLQTQEEAKERCKRLRQLADTKNQQGY